MDELAIDTSNSEPTEETPRTQTIKNNGGEDEVDGGLETGFQKMFGVETSHGALYERNTVPAPSQLEYQGKLSIQITEGILFLSFFDNNIYITCVTI